MVAPISVAAEAAAATTVTFIKPNTVESRGEAEHRIPDQSSDPYC